MPDRRPETSKHGQMIHETYQGERIPALGFGTYHLRGETGVSAIRAALEIGYRHIDTASRYENEEEVGRAIKASGVAREDIFLATKLRYLELDPAGIEKRTQESLARLGVDQVDLLMPHWPSPTHPVPDIMRAFARVRDKGYARHIGMSNFPTAQMREAMDAFGGPLFGNQIEYHPFLDQSAIHAMLRAHSMILTAAVPLARGGIEGDPVLAAIAEEHGKSPAQITLRWLVQQDGVMAIPKSGTPARIRANFEIFDFALTPDQMARIDALKGDRRLVDPDWAPVTWDPPAPVARAAGT